VEKERTYTEEKPSFVRTIKKASIIRRVKTRKKGETGEHRNLLQISGEEGRSKLIVQNLGSFNGEEEIGWWERSKTELKNTRRRKAGGKDQKAKHAG